MNSPFTTLPYGPQLNNFAELLESILDSKDADAEALTDGERKIIRQIASKYPTDQKIQSAVKREEVWKEKGMGTLIPYTDAASVRGI